MKKIAFIFAVSIGIATMMSCDPNNNNNTNDNYMRCKLNGTLWESATDDVGAIYNSGSSMVTFSGDDGSTMITANLAGITGLGDFPVGVGTSSAMSVYTAGQFYYINTTFGTGTFYLDEIKDPSLSSHNFKGRFEGAAVNASNDTIVITEGVIESF